MIVTDVSHEALAQQGIEGEDARQVRAFAAFLRQPKDDAGRTVCSQPMYDYALGGDLPPDGVVAEALGGA